MKRVVRSWLSGFLTVLLVAGLGLGAASLLPAQPAANTAGAVAAHPRVPGFERFPAKNEQQQVAAGELLLGELGCVTCHSVSEKMAAHLPRKQAPILSQVGSRVRVEWLRKFIADPAATKPGTTMPNPWAGVDAERKKASVEALTHYLALTGQLAETSAAPAAVKRGEELFHQIGCTACHDSRKDDAAPLPDSMQLVALATKYSIPSLTQFLTDPLAVRPAGRMPSLNLNPEEARAIASYLLKEVTAPASVKFEYFEGEYSKLPKFAELKPAKIGTVSGFDIQVGRRDNFAMRFTSFLRLPKEANYRFHLSSDDGSRLLVDGRQVVDADGVHPPGFKQGEVKLSAGVHELVVEYFEAGGGEEITVEIEGDGIARQSLDGFLSLTREAKSGTSAPAAFIVDPTLAAEGQKQFVELGCINCHVLGETRKPSSIQEQITARPPPTLAQLKSTTGCVAEKPVAKLPHYPISAAQRTALQAALSQQQKPAAADATREAPAVVEATMRRMNCYACHARGGIGGPVEGREKFFTSNQPEMGDEGRLPPPLSGVGAKLQTEWLQHIFRDGAKDRPYMLTRMPKFGEPNVGSLVSDLAKADPDVEYQRVEAGVSATVLKSTGRKLVGSQGFSCIKCHTWGNVPASGIQSIGMTTMTKRLKESWFHRYVLDPAAFRPGTRMPAAWPNGQTLLPKILDGDAQKQIHSVWAFLSDGEKATMPTGLGRDPIELVAVDEPVIYRNFIEGAGARAIGVGYPEKVNLAFDANQGRPALLWQGSFIDAARHWTDRGVGYQPPLGDNVLKLPTGVTVAKLAQPDEAWPTAAPRQLGYQFRGYELDSKRRPVFAYEVSRAKVSESYEPIGNDDQPGFRRTVRVIPASDAESLYVRLAAGSRIVEGPNGGFVIDDQSRLKVTAGAARPIVRKVGNSMELLVPVPAGAEPAQVVVEWFW
ncbi:MAG: c-type cytochrome [Planctomycetota bacterium]